MAVSTGTLLGVVIAMCALTIACVGCKRCAALRRLRRLPACLGWVACVGLRREVGRVGRRRDDTLRADAR